MRFLFLFFASVTIENILSTSVLECGSDKIAYTNFYKVGNNGSLLKFFFSKIVFHISSICKLAKNSFSASLNSEGKVLHS